MSDDTNKIVSNDAEALRYALVMVRAHVGRSPGASRELLKGLLDSIDRISAEALQTTPVSAPQPAPSTDDAGRRERYDKLFAAVKKVVTQRADDLCWRDVYTELAKLVGVEFVPEMIDDTDKMLANCRKFITSLKCGGWYTPVYVEKNADDTGRLAKAIELARDATLGKVKFLHGATPTAEDMEQWQDSLEGLRKLFIRDAFSTAPATADHPEPETNPCPISFSHMPHDYCDGKPNAGQLFGNLTAETRGDEGKRESMIAFEKLCQSGNVPFDVKFDLRLAWDVAWNAARAELLAKVDKLETFKAYVHKRLDDYGVQPNPDGPHSKHGCRIGDRLDIALSERAALRAKVIDDLKAEKDKWQSGLVHQALNAVLTKLNQSDPGEVKPCLPAPSAGT